MKLSRSAALLLVAGSSACILFGVDDLTGDGNDAGMSDATGDSVAPPTDASTDATPTSDAAPDAAIAPFDCDSIDATFCDDFNRDGAIAPGAPWYQPDIRAGCTLVVDGTLVSTFDASTGNQICFLESNMGPETSHFTLDFDMSFVADPASPQIVVVGVQLTLPSVSSAGVLFEQFNLYVGGNGSGAVQVMEYYPDAAASPNGNQFPSFVVASATPFTQASPACHITLDGDALTPAATATATCGKIVTTTTAQVSMVPAGFKAPVTIALGFRNPDITAPAWSITYDNMVLRTSP